MRVIFFGTPIFAAEVLQYLLDHGVHVAAVVTKPDRPKGRSGNPIPTAVKELVQNHWPDIPVFQPLIASDPAFADKLQAFDADLFVVVAYGEIIKQRLLDMPKKGCINLHTSLLPKYRGAAPIQHCIINGESKTGVTIIHMSSKMDAGDIIRQVEIPIDIDDTFPIVEKELCLRGSELLFKVIKDFERGNVERTSQDDSQVTFAGKIELENCEIDFNRSASELHNLIRAVTPHPGAWSLVEIRGQKKRLKIYLSQLISLDHAEQPGRILTYNKSEITVACGKDALSLMQLQLEGKKTMSAKEFVQGIPESQIKFLKL